MSKYFKPGVRRHNLPSRGAAPRGSRLGGFGESPHGQPGVPIGPRLDAVVMERFRQMTGPAQVLRIPLPLVPARKSGNTRGRGGARRPRRTS